MEATEAARATRWHKEALVCLRLAAPIIGAQLSLTSMGAVDSILAGRLGARPLAAVAVGANIWFLILILFMGLFMAISPIIAQRIGAQRAAEETGSFLRGALKLACICGLGWTVFLEILGAPLLTVLH